jgi:hypothetical protein
MEAPACPSTRRTTVFPAESGGNKIDAVSLPLVSGRAGSGSVPGVNAAVPPTVPEIANADRFSARS